MGDGTEFENNLSNDPDYYFQQYAWFDKFKPLSSSVPDRPFLLLPSIAARARRLLQGRNHKQVISAASTIDWLISDHRALIKAGKRQFADYVPINTMGDGPNDVEILKDGINWYVLGDDEEFPDGEESEYFAVLALSYLAEALDWLAGHKDGRVTEGNDFYSMSMAGEFALRAMDAISHGEQSVNALYYSTKFSEAQRNLQNTIIRVNEIAAKQAQEKISIRASKNAIKGHAIRNEAREFAKREWRAHSDSYDGNKSAFARYYVRRVKNEYNVDVTEKQMREVWLVDTPPASKPAGKLAGG